MDNAAKPDLRSRMAGILQHVPGSALLFAGLLLALLGYFGWYYYGADHLDHALYSLKYEKLSVTPQPAWIKTNVAEDVFHNGRLDRISLLESRANAAIAQAFETHSWVKSTTRVSKAVGGKVMVDVVYRKPAAMVYTEYLDREKDPPRLVKGFYAIDEDATVLPTPDFSGEDTWNYFMIHADDARLAGAIGMPFGDARVVEALRLAIYLQKYREPHQLQEIWVQHDGFASGPSPWKLCVTTKDRSTEIVWGHAPQSEGRGEPPAEEKLNRMLAWLKQPPAATSSEPRSLDLRSVNSAVPVSSTRQH